MNKSFIDKLIECLEFTEDISGDKRHFLPSRSEIRNAMEEVARETIVESQNNMEISKQVTNLELSNKLKELGVKQESLWYWCDVGLDKLKVTMDKQRVFSSHCSAFTVAELMKILPPTIDMEGEHYYLEVTKEPDGRKYWVGYAAAEPNQKGLLQAEVNLADSLANMLEHLLENNLYE